jgi:hypothetical protein
MSSLNALTQESNRNLKISMMLEFVSKNQRHHEQIVGVSSFRSILLVLEYSSKKTSEWKSFRINIGSCTLWISSIPKWIFFYYGKGLGEYAFWLCSIFVEHL